MAAGENAACALTFAGAVSLQAMLLGLPLAGLSKSKFAAVSMQHALQSITSLLLFAPPKTGLSILSEFRGGTFATIAPAVRDAACEPCMKYLSPLLTPPHRPLSNYSVYT